MKTPYHYTAIGLALFSASLLGLAPQVAAQDHQAPPLTSTNEQPLSNTLELNQAIDKAVEAGLIVTEGEPLSVDTSEEAKEQLISQTTIIQAVTENYQVAEATYQAEEKRYQDSLNQRRQVLIENQTALAKHAQQMLTYQQELGQYQAEKERYDQTKAAESQLMANYEVNYQNYLTLQKEWELEKALYDEKVAQAQAQTSQDGFLSQVHAQHLIFKSEPNAQVSFSGVETFIAASHDFGAGLNGIGNRASDVPHATIPHLSVGVGWATAAGPGNGYGLILKKNQPITVTYTNLEKSSYKGRPIRQVVYTYELTSTFAADNSATTFIYSDPTKTIYTGTGGDNQGLVDFNIHQTITYYYDETEPVVLDPDSTALFSFASRNNTFEFGEQEYVRLGDNMTFIPITGSSVTGENGYLASRGSNNSTADGSRLNRGDWDQDGHANEYYGAGVAKVTGTTIAFDFGIRYSQADINRSANPGRLRNGSRQWFTVNSDLKASGWLDSSLRPAPTPPEKPQLDTSLTEPIAPSQPVLTLKPLPIVPRRPKAPDKPVIIYYPIKLSPQRSTVTPPKESVTPTSSPAKPSENRGSTGPQSSLPTNTTSRQPQTSVTVIHLPVVTNTNQWGTPSTSPSPTRPTQPTTIASKKPLTAYYKGETKADAYEKGLMPAFKTNPALMEKFLPEYWFGVNTGFTNPKERQAIMDFIRQAGKVARQTYPDNKGTVNREIAQSLAHAVYSEDDLQKLFNEYGIPLKINNFKEISEYIKNQHTSNSPTVPIDFAHIMTTLASLEHQDSGLKNLIRWVFNSGIPGLSPLLNGKANILHQNGLLGDILTSFSQKDALSDIDAIILSKHPKFNKLPMDDRLLTYYSQPNLDKIRHQLLLETYSDSPAIAKTKIFGELLLSAASLGGALATVYGVFGYRTRIYEDLDGDGVNELNPKKSLLHAPKNILKSIAAIGNNIVATDRYVFQGALARFAKNPIKTINNYQAALGKKLLQETTTSIVGVKLPFSAMKVAAGIFWSNAVVKPVTRFTNKIKGKSKNSASLPMETQPVLPSSQQHPKVNPKAKQAPKQPDPSSSFNGPLLPSGGSHGVPSPKKPSKPRAPKPTKKPSLIPPQEDYPRLPSSNPIGRGRTKPSAPAKPKQPIGKSPNPGSSLNGPLLPSGGNNGVPTKPKAGPPKPKPTPSKPKPKLIHLPKKEDYPRLPTSNPSGRGAGKPQPTPPKKPVKTPNPVSNYPLLPTSTPVNRGTIKPAPKPKTQPKPPVQTKPQPRVQPRPPAPPKVQPQRPQPRVQPRPPKAQPKRPQQPKRGKK